MLGLLTILSDEDFEAHSSTTKPGYSNVEQISPGVAKCPRCGKEINAKKMRSVRATHETIKIFGGKHSAVKVCCSGFWCYFNHLSGKWSFRKKDVIDQWQIY